MRAISILAAAIGLTALVFTLGCTSVVKKQDGTFDVPRQVEVRSAFGTNQSAMRIDNCKREVLRSVVSNDYLDCTEVVPYQHASSPGAGGPIVSGMVMGLGFGLGLAHSGSVQNATTDVRASTVNPPVKK